MLFLQPGVGGILRVHGPYVTEGEIQRVVDHLKSQGSPVYDSAITAPPTSDEPDPSRDEMFDAAVEEVSRAGRASVSFLQRRLKIGFNRRRGSSRRWSGRGSSAPPRAGSSARCSCLARRIEKDAQVGRNGTVLPLLAWLLAAPVIFAGPVRAEGPPEAGTAAGDALLRKVGERYSAARTLSARFRQEVPCRTSGSCGRPPGSCISAAR